MHNATFEGGIINHFNQNGTSRHIENSSDAAQMTAVQEDGCAIGFIKNPSEAVQMAAVKKNGYAIEFIKNPSEAVQMAAVQQNGYVIQYIKNPSEGVLTWHILNHGLRQEQVVQ